MQYHWPLIGHRTIKEYFSRALAAGRMHHACLFSGPAQVGKFTFAKMLARTLVCEQEGARPCGACRACVALAHSCHPDVSHLAPDEGGHIAIEQARKLIHTLATKPLLSPWRIGIIEQADQLTTEAASALLKTIEEPGPDVRLMLTAVCPVLPTVASRCQRIQFSRVPIQELENAFPEVPLEMLTAAQGCPGRVQELSEAGAFAEYQETRRQVENLLTKDEGTRLIWISEQFGGRGDLSERREACRTFLQMLEQVVRVRIAQKPQYAPMLQRSMEAEQFLRSNVDPRLAAEYVLLTQS